MPGPSHAEHYTDARHLQLLAEGACLRRGLDHNILAGTIPPEMSKLTALQSMYEPGQSFIKCMRGVQYTFPAAQSGSQASVFGKMTRYLTQFPFVSTRHLSHAHISGSIPPELSTLTSLSYL